MVVFDDVQVSYAVSVGDYTDTHGQPGTKMILTRETGFETSAGYTTDSAANISVHGADYTVTAAWQGVINQKDRYIYTFSIGGENYQSFMKGELDKVWINGLTFEIFLDVDNDKLVLTEENVTNTGEYLTTESIYPILSRIMLEVKADVAGPAGSIESDGVLDVEDVKHLKINMMDVNEDGMKDNRDLDVVWSIIDFNSDLVNKYDYNPNSKLDMADIDALEVLLAAPGAGLNLDLNNDGDMDEHDSMYLRQIVTAELVKQHIINRLDTDHNGILEDAEREMLEGLVATANADLNGDGIVDVTDMEEFNQIKDFADDIIGIFGTTDYTTADINSDHIVDYKDAAMLEEAWVSYDDINGDGDVNIQDDYVLEAVINPDSSGVTNLPLYGIKVVDLPQYMLPASVQEQADFDGNGTINQMDFDLWSQFDMNQVRHAKGAAEDVINTSNFASDGVELSMDRSTGNFEQEITVQTAGTHRLAVTASSSQLTILYVDVYVDDEYKGKFSLGASAQMASEGYIDIDFEETGKTHLVRVELENASSRAMTITMEEFIVTEPIPAAYDIDGDKSYTIEDGRVIQRMMTAHTYIQRSDINTDNKVDFDDMAILDIDGDGIMSAEEKVFDVDGDGVVRQEEARRDVDRNGSIDQPDLDMLRHMLNSIDFIARADVNSDGFTDAGDLNSLRDSLSVLNSPERLALSVDTVEAIGDEFHTVARDELARSDLNGDGLLDSRDQSMSEKFVEEGLIDTVLDVDLPLLSGTELKIGDTVYDDTQIASMLAAMKDIEAVDGELAIYLLDEEDFDRGALLPDWQEKAGQWTLAGSKCSVPFISPRKAEESDAITSMLLYEKTPKKSYFTLETEVKITRFDTGWSSEGSGSSGLIFKYQDADNYYEYVINPITRRLEFRKIIDGQAPVVVAYKNLGRISARKWNTLTVKAEGPKFTFYFNGEEEFQAYGRDFYGHSFDAGKIGLAAGQFSGVEFDNVSVGARYDFEDIITKTALDTDLDFDGEVDEWDYAIFRGLNELQANSTEDVINAMARIAGADVNGDTMVDEKDREFFDLDQDGDTDMDDVYIAAEAARMSTEYTEHDKVDLDQSGIVNANDAEALATAISNMIDINLDGVFNQADYDLMIFIKINMSTDFSERWIDTADVNGDGFIDAHDMDAITYVLDNYETAGELDVTIMEEVIEALGNEYSSENSMVLPEDFARADVNADGKVNALDIAEINEVMDFVVTSSDPEIAYTMVDLYRYDINQDEVFDDQDIADLEYIKLRTEEGKFLTVEEVQEFDLDGDGELTVNDYTIAELTQTYHATADVDGNGIVDTRDRSCVTQVISSKALGLTKEMIDRADLNDDGEITYKDTLPIEDALRIGEMLDRDMDGLIQESEIELAEHLIEGFAEGSIVEKKTITSADINEDGVIDKFDIESLQAQIDDIRSEVLEIERGIDAATALMDKARLLAVDVNGDGQRTQADEDHIKEIIEFLDYRTQEEITDLLIQAADIDQDGKVDWDDMAYMDMHFTRSYENNTRQGYVEMLDLDGDGYITDQDFSEFEDIRYAMNDGDIPNIRQFEKFDLTGDGKVDIKDINKVKNAYKGRVDIDGDFVINDPSSSEGGPNDGTTDSKILQDLIAMQSYVEKMNVYTAVDDPLSVVQVLLNEDLSKNRQVGLNRFYKAAGIDGSGDGKLSAGDLSIFELAMVTRDNSYYDLDADGAFTLQDLFLMEEIVTEILNYKIYEAPSILDDDVLCGYGRTILQPVEFDRRDVTNDLVIDVNDLEAIQEAQERQAISFTEDQLIRIDDARRVHKFRALNIPIAIEDIYRSNFVTEND
ncbi:MAG: family 16 glycoside hydrolase, partial [Candidatus Omnitrophota bacterium]